VPETRTSPAPASEATRAPCGRQKTVAGGIDLAPAEARELPADHGVMLVEQITPPPVAERDGALRGADDVSEHDRGHDPIRLLPASGAREKLLDLVDEDES
jgi:hypothetical protein